MGTALTWGVGPAPVSALTLTNCVPLDEFLSFPEPQRVFLGKCHRGAPGQVEMIQYQTLL